MKIRAQVKNSAGQHEVSLQTKDRSHSIVIPPKEAGLGSSANGGELLFLALATCYCNDLYREAAKRGIEVEYVEVDVEGDFGAEGAPAQNVGYTAKIKSKASDEEIRALVQHTDMVAEIQNTLRVVTPVTLRDVEINS